MIDRERIGLIEALLFVSDRPLPARELAEFLGDDDVQGIERQLEQLAERLETSGSALHAENVAGGWRLATRPEHGDAVKEFFRFKNRQRLSRAALETLAIVAYKQPTTHPEIQEIRGVASEGVLRTLQDRRLVRTAGRKDTVGKPLLYGTTRDFLEHFGLSSLDDLPPMEEFETLVAQVEGVDGDAVQQTLEAVEEPPSTSPGPDGAAPRSRPRALDKPEMM